MSLVLCACGAAFDCNDAIGTRERPSCPACEPSNFYWCCDQPMVYGPGGYHCVACGALEAGKPLSAG